MPTHPATSDAALHPGVALLTAARRGNDEAVLQAGCRIAVADPLLAAMCGEQIVKAMGLTIRLLDVPDPGVLCTRLPVGRSLPPG